MRAQELRDDAAELVGVAGETGHSAGSCFLGAQERPEQMNAVGVEPEKSERLRMQNPKRYADVPRRVHVGRDGMRLERHEGRVRERKRRRVRRRQRNYARQLARALQKARRSARRKVKPAVRDGPKFDGRELRRCREHGEVRLERVLGGPKEPAVKEDGLVQR